LPTCPSIVASPGRYKTLLSPVLTWPMRSSRCASSCTTPGSHTLPLSNAFSTTSRALFLLVYTSLVKRILHYVKGTLSTDLHIGTSPLRTRQGARLPPLHIGLLRLPRRHLGALVVQALDHYLSLKCRSRVPCRHPCRRRVLLVVPASHFVREKVALGEVRVLHVPPSVRGYHD
jgi:hypothetical protein